MSEHKYTTREVEEVFVLYFDDKPMYVKTTGWNDWRAPKKIYYTIGAAKNGIAQLPLFIDRLRVSIVRYIPE